MKYGGGTLTRTVPGLAAEGNPVSLNRYGLYFPERKKITAFVRNCYTVQMGESPNNHMRVRESGRLAAVRIRAKLTRRTGHGG